MLYTPLRRLAAAFVVLGALVAAQAAFATSAGQGDPTVDVGGVAAVETALEAVHYGDDIEMLSAHRVVDGALVDPVGAAHEGWLLVREIVPEPHLGSIGQFGVFTDGLSDTLAMVHRSARPGGGWIVSLDEADLVDRRLMRETLVHELAHVVTLDVGSVTFGIDDPDDCDGRVLAIGCATTGSTLERFAVEFWSGLDEPAEHDPAVFVNDYAATSVHEDLAESFLTYVLDPDGDHPPTVAAKLAFLHAEPDLASLAVELRTRLG